MRQRIFSSIILYSVVFVTLWVFQLVGVVILLTILSACSQWEFYKTLKARSSEPDILFGITVGTLLLGIPFGLYWGGYSTWLLSAFIVSALTIMGCLFLGF